MTKEDLLKMKLSNLTIVEYLVSWDWADVYIKLKRDLRKKEFIELKLDAIRNDYGIDEWAGVFSFSNPGNPYDEGEVYLTPFPGLYGTNKEVMKLVDKFKPNPKDPNMIKEIKYEIEKASYYATHRLVSYTEWADYCRERYSETNDKVWHDGYKEYDGYYKSM